MSNSIPDPADDAHEWGVWSWAEGVVYTAEPPSQMNAITEAAWADEPKDGEEPRVLHTAIPLYAARLMRNAFAWGRMEGIRSVIGGDA